MNTVLLPISQFVQHSAMPIDIVSMAAGLAVSRHLDLPTSPVDSVNIQYVSFVEPTAGIALSKINESVIINLELALKTARSAWMLRYNAAYPKADGSVILPCDCSGFFDRVFTVGMYFDKATQDKLNCNSNEVITLTNRFLAVLPALISD